MPQYRIVQTVWAWSFILLIAFRFLPNSIITRPIAAVWIPLVERPWFMLSYRIRLALGVIAILGLVFGSAFGFELPEVRSCRSCSLVPLLNALYREPIMVTGQFQLLDFSCFNSASG